MNDTTRALSFYLLPALLAVTHAFGQPESPAIERSVDDHEYQCILEYYQYDPGMPADPVLILCRLRKKC